MIFTRLFQIRERLIFITELTIIGPGPTTYKSSCLYRDVLGRLYQVIDGLNNTYGSCASGTPVTTAYGFDADSNLTTVTVDSTLVNQRTYDVAGNLTQLYDSNFGASGTCAPTTSGCYWTFAYNGLGERTQHTDPAGKVSNYTYDLMSRPLTRTDGSASHAWAWDPTNARGSIASRTSPGFSKTYTYGTAGPMSSSTTTINPVGVPAKTITFNYNYDVQYRMISTTSPNANIQPVGLPPIRSFTPEGYPWKLTSGAAVLDQINATNAFGEVTQETFPNTVGGAAQVTTTGYDPISARLTSISTGTSSAIQNQTYSWWTDGALGSRGDGLQGFVDTFSYDTQARLTAQATNTAPGRTLGFTYDKHGNLTSKSNPLAGDLTVTGQTFGSAGRPQRLTSVSIGGIANTLSYDNLGSITQYAAASGDSLFLAYDGDNRVTKITKGTSAGTTTPTGRDEFWYDSNGGRFLRRQTWMQSSTLRTQYTYYADNYEGVTDGAGAIVIDKTDYSDRVGYRWTPTYNRFEIKHHDHLGSYLVSYYSSGFIGAFESRYDPFGARRTQHGGSDPSSAERTYFENYDALITNHGFTNQEHLIRTGLTHFNGRVYDSRLGRFVSADPVYNDGSGSQAYNRYSYVMNNPMMFTDPSGYDPAGRDTRHIFYNQTVNAGGETSNTANFSAGKFGGFGSADVGAGLQPGDTYGGQIATEPGETITYLGGAISFPPPPRFSPSLNSASLNSFVAVSTFDPGPDSGQPGGDSKPSPFCTKVLEDLNAADEFLSNLSGDLTDAAVVLALTGLVSDGATEPVAALYEQGAKWTGGATIPITFQKGLLTGDYRQFGVRLLTNVVTDGAGTGLTRMKLPGKIPGFGHYWNKLTSYIDSVGPSPKCPTGK